MRVVQTLTLALMFLPLLAFGSGGDLVPGSRYVSGRGASMGDAFISFADDGAGALFYNPAAIGRLKDLYLEPLNLQVQSNGELGKLIGSGGTNFYSLSDYKSTMVSNPNVYSGGSGALTSSIAFRGFAFGVLAQSRLRGAVVNDQVIYSSVYQLIPAAGFGIRLASGVLRLGYVMQYVNQASGDKTVSVNSTPMGWNMGLSEGAGFSHNFGLALTLPYVFQPALNIVARNVGGLSFNQKAFHSFAKSPSSTPQPDEEMSLDASLSFLTKIGNGNELRTAVDYRDALGSSNQSALGRLATGLEFSLRDRFFIRGGVGSGYPAAGIGVRTRRSEVNIGWFSEEVGDSFRDKRDIRYIFQYRLRAF